MSTVVAVPVATVSIASVAPSLSAGKSTTIPAASIAIDAAAPFVAAGASVFAPSAQIQIAAFIPEIETGVSIDIPVKEISVRGYDPIFFPAINIGIAPVAPSVSIGSKVEVPFYNALIAAFAPAVRISATVFVDSAFFSAFGRAPTLTIGASSMRRYRRLGSLNEAVTFTIKQNDTSPSIEAALIDASGSPINLLNAGVSFHMRNMSNNVTVVDSAATIYNESGGIVRYAFDSADTAKAGMYSCEFEVTYADSSVETFPSKRNIILSVESELA